MQATSQQWKNAQRQTLVPESYIEIEFRVGDPNAQAEAEVVDNGAEFFCDPPEIMEDVVDPIKYAMLEPDKWILDGTYRILGGSIEPVPPSIGAIVGLAIVGQSQI